MLEGTVVLVLVLVVVAVVGVLGGVEGKSTSVACDHPLCFAATVCPIAAANTTPQCAACMMVTTSS